MNYSYILCFMCIWLTTVSCAPVASETSFYDAIVQKCPSLHSDTAYQTNPIFTACKDWKRISEVNQLTGSNEKDIRCLLYFDSFTEYCTQASKINTTVPNPILVSYGEKIDTICDYAKSVSNKNLSTIFSNNNNCKKICSDDLGFVDSVCGMSYYFAHRKVELHPDLSQLSRESATSKTNVTDQKSKVPILKSVQLDGPIHADKTAEQNKTSQTKKLTAPTQEQQSQHEQSMTNVNSPSINADAKKDQLDPSDSHINLLHGVDNAVNNAAAMPNIAENPPLDGSILQDHVVAQIPTDVEEEQNPVQLQHEPAPNDKGKEISPVNNAEKSVEQPAKPPTEKSPTQSVHAPTDNVAKPAEQNSEEDGKRVDTPAIGIETDNQDLQQDLEDDKQTAQQQQIANQDTDVDDDLQLPPDGQDDDNLEPPVKPIIAKEKDSKPMQTDETDSSTYSSEMDGDSYFFTYFMLLCIIFIVGYVCYHNKQKILALILEGRKGRRQYRGRRPNSANYHKLDSNLEEAITSSCKKNTNNVIY